MSLKAEVVKFAVKRVKLNFKEHTTGNRFSLFTVSLFGRCLWTNGNEFEQIETILIQSASSWVDFEVLLQKH